MLSLPLILYNTQKVLVIIERVQWSLHLYLSEGGHHKLSNRKEHPICFSFLIALLYHIFWRDGLLLGCCFWVAIHFFFQFKNHPGGVIDWFSNLLSLKFWATLSRMVQMVSDMTWIHCQFLPQVSWRKDICPEGRKQSRQRFAIFLIVCVCREKGSTQVQLFVRGIIWNNASCCCAWRGKSRHELRQPTSDLQNQGWLQGDDPKVLGK